MYDFAIVALLALAALKVTDALVGVVPKLAPGEPVLRFLVAVLGVIALDYSVFSGFDVGLRETWMGPLTTGLIVGALAGAWSAVLGFLSPVARTPATPATPERHRMAA